MAHMPVKFPNASPHISVCFCFKTSSGKSAKSNGTELIKVFYNEVSCSDNSDIGRQLKDKDFTSNITAGHVLNFV